MMIEMKKVLEEELEKFEDENFAPGSGNCKGWRCFA